MGAQKAQKGTKMMEGKAVDGSGEDLRLHTCLSMAVETFDDPTVEFRVPQVV